MIVQRLTSDPHAHELVAPHWSLNKSEVLTRIRAELERRDTCQGRRAQKRTSNIEHGILNIE